MIAGRGLKTFGVMKMIVYVRSVSLGVKKKLYEGEVVPTVTWNGNGGCQVG